MEKLTTKTQFTFNNAQFVIPAVCQYFSSFQIAYETQDNWVKATDDDNDWMCHIHVDGDLINIHIDALTLELLHEMKEAVLAYLQQLSPAIVASIQWQDGADYHKKRKANFAAMTVKKVTSLTPHMQRIVFSVDDINRFYTKEYLHCKLYFPQHKTSEIVWPVLNEQGILQYQNDQKAFDVRTYTIRSMDVERRELTIDMLMHGDNGPGSSWVLQAKEGDQIGLLAPIGKPVKLTDWMLLIGDETALPAISRMLETMSAESKGTAIIEVEDEKDILQLAHPAGVMLQWVCRKGNRDGKTLMNAVRNITWPEDIALHPFVWAGVEFDMFKALRQYFFEELAIEKQQQLIVSYWRKGKSESSDDVSHD